jgi:hypothetical protein
MVVAQFAPPTMGLEKPDQDSTSRQPLAQREIQGLELFPSEREAGIERLAKSRITRSEGFALAEFPSEATTSPGMAAVPAPQRHIESPPTWNGRILRFRTVSKTHRGLLLAAATAALGTVIGMTAVVRSKPVLELDQAPLQTQTPAPAAAETPFIDRSTPPSPPDLAPSSRAADIGTKVVVAGTPPAVPNGAAPAPEPSSAPLVAVRPQRSAVESTLIKQLPRRRIDLQETGTETPAFQGLLSVETEATGARVYVDGVLAGATPMASWQVKAGSHVVRIEQDGYQRWSTVVRVVAGETTRVVPALRPAALH